MITIQSQDKQLWEDNHIGHGYDKSKAVIYCHGYVVGAFDNVEQRNYVLDRIALAIERGDKLYRMPSVEEVENMISGKDCDNCRSSGESLSSQICSTCIKSKPSNWQPKEQEG